MPLSWEWRARKGGRSSPQSTCVSVFQRTSCTRSATDLNDSQPPLHNLGHQYLELTNTKSFHGVTYSVIDNCPWLAQPPIEAPNCSKYRKHQLSHGRRNRGLLGSLHRRTDCGQACPTLCAGHLICIDLIAGFEFSWLGLRPTSLQHGGPIEIRLPGYAGTLPTCSVLCCITSARLTALHTQANLQPSAAVQAFTERVKRIARQNQEIADWLQVRKPSLEP